MTDDTDLTDLHGEAEALRKENARLRAERDYDRRQSAHKSTVIDRLNVRAEAEEARVAFLREALIHAGNDLSTHLEVFHDSEEESREASNLRHLMSHIDGALIGMDDPAEAALAASRALDPVVNADSCQPGDLISRIAAHPAVDEIAQEVANILARHIRALPTQPGDLISRAAAIEALGFAAWMHQGTDAYSQGMDAGARHQAKQDYEAIRAIPAAPATEAATCLHLTADMAARCPTCNPGLSTTLPDAGSEAKPTIGGAELDALVKRLLDGPSRVYRDIEADKRAADAITALRAQPDWKAMAERMGDAMKPCLNFIENTESEFGIALECGNKARAALSDLAKMKGE